MKNYNVQIKISGIFDVPCSANSIEHAIELGRKFQWKNILAKNVQVADGQREVIGAWDNNAWDVILPAHEGLMIKTKGKKEGIVTLISMLGKTIALWKQMK